MFLPTIRLRGLGHDGSGGVSALNVRCGRTHYPRRGATLQSQSCTQCRQCRYQHRNDNLDDLLLGHNH